MKKVTFFLIVIVGVVFLQIFLSKRQNKWYGLFIPVICFMFSLWAVMGMSAYTYSGYSELRVQTTAPNGTVTEEVVEQHGEPLHDNIGGFIAQAAVVFVFYNIPTAIFMIIYFACRENLRKNAQLGKMQIQDLE